MQFRMTGCGAVDQPIDARRDSARGDRDDRHLGDRRERLCLAMAELLIMVGRHSGNPDVEQCNQRASRSSPVSTSDPSMATEPSAKRPQD